MAQFDNYLPCEDYAGAPLSPKYPGFHAWQAEGGAYYFAAVSKRGQVQLRSEAYTTEEARDNGIESVMRNRDTEGRYKVVQEDGYWYLTLRAGNNQEIARSCAFDSEATATAAIATYFSTYQERSSSKGITDNYLPCEDYAGAPLSPKYPGFHAWQAESGAYYFAAVSKRGQVQLRSEAYTTEEARDNGIESVMRNRDTEGRYKVVQEDGHWYLALRAGNNQEIARSCAFDSAAAATAAIATCFSTYQERAASRAIVEDYLPCEDYAGHKPAARYEGFTQFQHTDDGQHYFAMVDKDGKVVLRSEGYKSADARDNGIESVIRNRDIKEHWVKSQDADGHYLSLRAGNRQEIARTCPYESESALMGWWLPFASAAYVWGRPAGGSVTSLTGAAPTVAPVVEKTAPPPPPVVISTKKEAAPPPLTTYRDAEPAAAAGSGWWKWLLGALLLAGLLWLLMRGCNADQTAKVAAPVTTTAPAPPPANTGAPPSPTPAQPEAAAKPNASTPAPAATCNCDKQTDPVFNLPTGAMAKKLSRLGTNPEFGDSHGLSPEEFYQKLSRQYKANAVDRAFLDRMYRAMGYPKGFAEAKAEQFSTVTLPQGSKGNLGYGKTHGTGYYELPDSERDRMAFHIEAANGCDLHFMKTCGNHFFFCSK